MGSGEGAEQTEKESRGCAVENHDLPRLPSLPVCEPGT